MRQFIILWTSLSSTFSAIPIIATIIVGFFLRYRLKAALLFWIFQQTKTTWQALILNSLLLISVAYLVMVSIVGIYSLYTSIIRKRLVKDIRVWDNYKRHQIKVLKWFLFSLLSALVLEIGTQLFGNAFQNFISRKG